jgi:helix-turn-helix protein
LVSATFDENWNGRATARMIAGPASYFRVPISQLIVDPAVAIGVKQRTDTPEFEQGVAMTNGQNVYAPEGDGVLTVTRKEAARRLSLSVTEIDCARRRGDLAAQEYGSKVLISVDELRRFAEGLPAD